MTSVEGKVPTLSDLPSGWRADPSEDEDEDDQIDCVSFDFSDLTQNGDAESDDFSMQSAEVSSSATVYEDEEQASTWKSLKARSLRVVSKRVIKKEVESGVEIGEVAVGEVSFPELAERTDAIQVEVPVRAEGQSASVYIDFVVMQEEDTLAALFFLDVVTPFDQQMKEELAGIVAGRMPREVAE